MESIIGSVITGVLALLGVVITVSANNRRIENEVRTGQAVMQEQIADLTREVRKHNGFAEKIPVMQEQIRVANHRIEDLEKGRNHD